MSQPLSAAASQPAVPMLAVQSAGIIPPGYVLVTGPAAPVKRNGLITRLLGGLVLSLFVMSIAANIYLTQFLGLLTQGPHESVYQDGDANNRIVILPIEGLISASTEAFVEQSLKVISADPDNMPRAVILRVESPGGYVGPSDRILHAIERFKQRHPSIPVLGSFGYVAASGGYYVAAACDHIIAEPTCTTGSIGVIVMAMTYGKLMEKLGVDTKVLVADGSPKKDVANNPFRTLNDVDEAKIKVSLNTAHEQFVAVVARGRSRVLTEEAVRALANGDTYNTKQAVENKLIDGEGYLDAAIVQAKTMAKITGNPRVTRIQPAHSFNLLGSLTAQQGVQLPKSGEELRTWLRDASLPRMEYLWAPGM